MIRTVPPALDRAREVVRPALWGGLDRLSPEIRRVAAYHLGFTDAEGRPSSADGGKAVRPTLALLSARAAGAREEVAIPGAVAVELVHNFSLLHDDVMDRDAERRHRPAVWALFGVGPAILAGDALLALAHRILTEAPGPTGRRAARALATATSDIIAGQGLDLAFESRLDVSVRECVRMCALKTAALFSCAASLGAILAGGGESMVRALRAYGHELGLAFQAVDDVLGVWGRAEATGKPVANDLRQHKKSLPVVLALAGRGPDRDRLSALLADGLPEGDVELAVSLLDRCGARERTLLEADRRLRSALRALRGIPAPVRAELAAIAEFVASREF